jgi:hypothetical protein
MIRTDTTRASRVGVTEGMRASSTLARRDYEASWEVTTANLPHRSAEQWVRAMLEGAPRLLRTFVVWGWVAGLGFRLGPRPSPNHVLGWTIVNSSPDVIVLSVQSLVVGTSQFVLRVEGTRVVLANFVQYERRGARAVWSIVQPLHHRVVPFLLGHAARP